MQPEQSFWNRVIQLAQETLKQSAFDYFVADAKLLKVEQHTATILLAKPVQELFWSQNLADILTVAGWEVYNEQLRIQYQIAEEGFSQKQQVNPTPVPTPQVERPLVQQQVIEPATIQENAAPFRTTNSNLKPQYTFDNFVQGDNNAMAKAAALAVSDNPGELYNPLFIHGGPGLGKTHLLNAIGNKVLENNPQARVKLVSSETFLNEFVEHTRLNKMKDFEDTYRNLDVLLIDDIQTLKNKKATQEEFFNTFNALYDKQKQIVLTSDRMPSQLDNLPERLVTRFSWGVTSAITPPDFETRIAILQSKCEAYPFYFTDDTMAYLAGQFNSNVRDLEGALKDISLLANMRHLTEITVDVAAEAIRSRKQDGPQTKVIPIEKIQTEVGNFYGVSVKEIKGSKRVQSIVHARQVAMYLARELTDNSLPKIGKEFGNRDHTTVMHAYNKIKNHLNEDQNLEIEITTIRNKIR